MLVRAFEEGGRDSGLRNAGCISSLDYLVNMCNPAQVIFTFLSLGGPLGEMGLITGFHALTAVL